MNLKYEVGQTVKVEANKTIVELMESEIKSITVCSTGAKYLTSKGAFSEEQLDAFALKAQPIAPQEDKPRFEVGRKVKVIGNCCCHGYSRGTILTLVRSVNFLRREPDWYVGEGTDYVSERDIEPYAEPVAPVSPDCAVDNLIYGYQSASFFANELLNRKRPVEPSLTVTREMLVKLGACTGGISTFDKLFPSSAGELEDVCTKAEKDGREDYSEWLSLRKDRIAEMQNEKEPEPVYYNGKVVCVEWKGCNYTAGKSYEVVNGYMTNNYGEKSEQFKSFDEIATYCHAKFIPYLGE